MVVPNSPNTKLQGVLATMRSILEKAETKLDYMDARIPEELEQQIVSACATLAGNLVIALCPECGFDFGDLDDDDETDDELLDLELELLADEEEDE